MKEFSVKILHEIKKLIPKDQKVEISSIMKNNGITEEAVSILEKDKNISPTIYLGEFYEWYKEGVELELLAAEIVRRNNEYKLENSLDIGFFVDYGKAKKRIVFKLINREKNRKLLENIPFIDYMDLVMVFYYLIHDEEAGNATILIHNSHLKMWGVSREEIYREACNNTPNLLPAAITGMREIIEQMMGEKIQQEETIPDEIPMYVMTNPMKMNGAATMAYPNVVRNFANALGKNVYIIPSSVHEVILVPESGTEGGRLNDMVREVNRTQVDPKEVLADHVYYYNREENRMQSYVCESVTYC
ncbi:MAG: hypothetical protein E7289_00660 [Lachnospiraceae bacterium]|nr:hypothetical protein [Lachnospiraceae bacterium]